MKNGDEPITKKRTGPAEVVGRATNATGKYMEAAGRGQSRCRAVQATCGEAAHTDNQVLKSRACKKAQADSDSPSKCGP